MATDPQDPWPWRTVRHDFDGRLDRVCERCNLPDRAEVHKIMTGPLASPLTNPAIAVIERDEPQTFEELAGEVDIRVDALRRGRTDWGCDGGHRGHYTSNQIAAGAPNCPTYLHHHHDPFCRMPSDLELRLAGVEKPERGWGSRA